MAAEGDVMGSAETRTSTGAESPLSIALLAPGWPLPAFANGVVTAVSTVRDGLRAQGHRVHVLTHQIVGPETDDVHFLFPSSSSSAKPPLVDRILYRLAPRLSTARKVGRAIAAQVNKVAAGPGGLDLVEIEEAFGWPLEVMRRTSVPIVVRLHGPWFLNSLRVGPADAEYRKRLELEGQAIARADGVTAPSADVLNQTRAFYNLPLPDAEVIPNAIAIPPAETHWSPDRCEPGLILFVGRFDRHKGGDTMIDAFHRLLPQAPEARLLFAGPDRQVEDDDGRRWSIADYVREKAPGLQESGRFEYLGQLDSHAVSELRRKAAVTVIPSRYEILGMTVLEALAHDSPLVAARTGGIPELVRDGDNGLLFNPGDADDLARTILRLLRDRDLAASFSRRAASSIEREFSPDAIATRTADFYRRVLARGRTRRRA